jgi:hypothetical protein
MRAAALAAVNLNQIFKKGKHKYENQDWHQSRPWRPADYPWLKNNGPKDAGNPITWRWAISSKFSMKGKDNHENQNERESWSARRPR